VQHPRLAPPRKRRQPFCFLVPNLPAESALQEGRVTTPSIHPNAVSQVSLPSCPVCPQT
jgi:hypothetical protein